jgi:hypothetical protein
MQHARPVRYPVGRTRRLERAVAICWGIGAVALGAWFHATLTSPVVVVTAGLVHFFVGYLAWKACRLLVRGELQWDGRCWCLDLQAGDLAVIADGQSWIFFHWRSTMGVQWGWADRMNARDRWADLRRAVYSRDDSDLQGDRSAKNQSR